MAQFSAVYVSGLHCGSDPLPGIGIARCVRQAFPNAHIVGVDYSSSSTGLSSPVLDRVWVPGAWSDLNLASYSETIKAVADDGAIWLSGLDLETQWLAGQTLPRSILTPSHSALAQIKKPPTSFGIRLGLKAPPTISLQADHNDLYAFCVENSWQIWLKTTSYSALPVRSWGEFLSSQRRMMELWGENADLFLEKHIYGKHVSIAFAAHDGHLISAILMRKELTTDDGKTISGKVEHLTPGLSLRLERSTAEIGWTGGGEIECIEDTQGCLWIMEVNPRFPSWIYGAALCGYNLPALLINSYCGHPLPVDIGSTGNYPTSFVRHVVEFPQKISQDFNIHHVARNNERADTDYRNEIKLTCKQEKIDLPFLRREISTLTPAATPARLLASGPALARFERIVAGCSSYSAPKCNLVYSIKTNPDRRLLQMVSSLGGYADAISQDEAAWAVACGIPPGKIILNGPAKLWPTWKMGAPARAIFADSLSELQHITNTTKENALAEIIGVRLRPSGVNSRFGVNIADSQQYNTLLSTISNINSSAIGLHFHYAPSTIGMAMWELFLEEFVSAASDIEVKTGKKVTLIDVGGGWTANQLDDLVNGGLKGVLRRISKLKNVEQVFIEPGKSIVEQMYFLFSSVIQIIRDEKGITHEIVVDASIADIPNITTHPHDVGFVTSDRSKFFPLGEGKARILGRTCMEADIIEHSVELPQNIAIGDLLVWTNSGAYDASMAYTFGRGGCHN